jgi:outer membrane cobalamin receptor
MRKDTLKLVLLLAIFGFYTRNLSAQDTTQSFFDLSLEDLLNMKVTVASKTALTARESPGIVTAIYADEIQASGARDLIDVFRLVPGLSFGVDVQGTVGLASRGNWGHEGKILMLIDGIEINENLFGTIQFGNHFDVNQIERIEIVRGPGSAIYGGYAELGVINIITKSGEDLSGIEVSSTYGQLTDATGRTNASIAVGKKMGDLDISLKGFYGIGIRSDEDYTDIYETTMNLADVSDISSANVNLGVSYKGLKFRALYDDYQAAAVDLFDEVLEEPANTNFRNYAADLRYQFDIGDNFSVTPFANFKYQIPWSETDTAGGLHYEIDYLRYTGGIDMSYDLTENISFNAGGEYYTDEASYFNPDASDETFSTGDLNVAYSQNSGYLQVLLKNKIANLTVGGRVIDHSAFGTAFAPRAGLTKAFDKLHLKLLYSQAFRAPSIINIDWNAEIKAEQTQVIEAEVGYLLSEKMQVTVNVFDITIDDPIVYFYDVDLDVEGYDNFTTTGTQGVELDYRFKDKWGYASVNYSFNTAKNKNTVDYYASANTDAVMIGMPQHKVNLISSIRLGDHFSVNPSVTYLSEREAYTFVDEEEESVVSTLESKVYLNLFLRYENLFIDGLTLGAGVHDILDAGTTFIQPYDGYHAPLPGIGREITVKLSYALGL